MRKIILSIVFTILAFVFVQGQTFDNPQPGDIIVYVMNNGSPVSGAYITVTGSYDSSDITYNLGQLNSQTGSYGRVGWTYGGSGFQQFNNVTVQMSWHGQNQSRSFRDVNLVSNTFTIDPGGFE